MWKWTKRALLALLLVGAVFLVNLLWFKPFFINHFYARVFLEYVLDSPETASALGLPIPGLNDDFDDASLAHEEETIAKNKESLEILKSYDASGMNEQELLSYDILLWFMENNKAQTEYRYHNYPVNQLFGMQNEMPSFMDASHNVNSESDAKAYIARLSKFGIKFAQTKEGLLVREEKGIMPPKFVLTKVLKEMQEFVAQPAQENILYVSFAEKMKKAGIDSLKANELLAEAQQQIEQTVYPAYKDYIAYFTALQAKATTDDGVWKLPDGEKFYQVMLRNHTTTDFTANEIHEIGLKEVARISGEMREIFTQQQLPADSSLRACMDALSKKPEFLYPDSDEGRKQCLADYQKIIDHISANLGEVFSTMPEAKVEVQRIPEFKEATSPGAYYNTPALDGSRPGVFFANLRNMNEIVKWSMNTLAYHEAVPGHHFQLAIQQEIEGVPFFRKVLPFTAYAEGWALYSEQLAWEYGFAKDPLVNLGRLQAEMFRAVRLVVDTGIHSKRWTREQAIDYMYANTGMGRDEVTAEIERYIVMPGQACAYKMGMLKILELRQKAQTQMGSRFNIKDFHNVVLKNGAMPLSILERVVDSYIKG